VRIATWNVERVKPQGWKIAPAQKRRMTEVDADIWILTETHIDHSPGHGYDVVHTPAIPDRRPANERGSGSGAGTRSHRSPILLHEGAAQSPPSSTPQSVNSSSTAA